MAYLIFFVISLALFVGFVSLTIYETRKGKRFVEGPRLGLDKQAGKLFFIIDHVDWGEFISHTFRSLVARMVHDTAYAILAFVRFVERQLTRIIRLMRDRRPNVLAPSASRESIFSQATSYVQNRMRRPKDAAEEKPEEEA